MNSTNKSPFIAPAITLLAVVALLAVVSTRIASSNKRYAEVVVTKGLGDFHSELKGHVAVVGSAKVALPTVYLRTILLTGERYKKYFPSFITQEDIFIASPQAELGATNLVCVVRVNRGFFLGVDGVGNVRNFRDLQREKWSHVGLGVE